MSTTLHSFMDIFDTTFGEGQESVQLKRIIIPIIQRDYAQGRNDNDAVRVRERFLDSLYKAVTEKPVTLDFIYGDIDTNGNMIPLDGQQRLTTLFLLHWYAAKKCSIPEQDYAFLKKFSYETRYSARDFCIDLVDYNPDFSKKISNRIVNQPWFPLDWTKDATISSMLVMIDAIDERFKSVDDIWDKLKNGCISFYFLPIKDMGLTDELYIKMNSRGKPLTIFEHFKAELERGIRSVDEVLANRIMKKIDCEWTDLLWNYRDSGSGSSDDNVIDDEFLRYFKFVCDVICYRQGQSPLGRSNDEFSLLSQYFPSASETTIENTKILEGFFDCWFNIKNYNSPDDFLKSFMSYKHEKDKILIESRFNLNIFEDCLHAYSDKSGRVRQFPLNRIVLLYAITVYLQNTDKVTEENFRRRIRIINNLIHNSEDEIVDRTDKNRMAAILAQTDAIILTGDIDDSIDNHYNVNQLFEEKEKMRYLEANPDMAETLYELEDHPMLYGQISIVGLDNLSCAKSFESLFSCNLDLVDCAMMSVGDYSQMEKAKWRYQFGSTNLSAWTALFHRSANKGFERTSGILLTLLSKADTFTNEFLNQMVSEYTSTCETNNTYPWRYYYVKYKIFRPGSYGKYGNGDVENLPYLYTVMKTRLHASTNSYVPFLKEVDDEHIDKDSLGSKLDYGDRYITCENDSYVIHDTATGEKIEVITIPQNEEGLDITDRIVILRDFLTNNGYIAPIED